MASLAIWLYFQFHVVVLQSFQKHVFRPDNFPKGQSSCENREVVCFESRFDLAL